MVRKISTVKTTCGDTAWKSLNWVVISSEKNWRLQLDVSISMLWSSSEYSRYKHNKYSHSSVNFFFLIPVSFQFAVTPCVLSQLSQSWGTVSEKNLITQLVSWLSVLSEIRVQGRTNVGQIPCKCGKVYIGETGRDLTTRLNKHKAHGRRGECDKSAIIKHSTDSDHVIDWQKAEIIAPEKHWYIRRIREATIHKHDTVPRDIGYFISSIWHSILPSINTHTPQSTDTPQ